MSDEWQMWRKHERWLAEARRIRRTFLAMPFDRVKYWATHVEGDLDFRYLKSPEDLETMCAEDLHLIWNQIIKLNPDSHLLLHMTPREIEGWSDYDCEVINLQLTSGGGIGFNNNDYKIRVKIDGKYYAGHLEMSE